PAGATAQGPSDADTVATIEKTSEELRKLADASSSEALRGYAEELQRAAQRLRENGRAAPTTPAETPAAGSKVDASATAAAAVPPPLCTARTRSRASSASSPRLQARATTLPWPPQATKVRVVP